MHAVFNYFQMRQPLLLMHMLVDLGEILMELFLALVFAQMIELCGLSLPSGLVLAASGRFHRISMSFYCDGVPSRTSEPLVPAHSVFAPLMVSDRTCQSRTKRRYRQIGAACNLPFLAR